MSGWIKKQKDKFLNLKFIDSKIKLYNRFVHYEHFYFVIFFIGTGVFLTYCIIALFGPTVAAAACYYIGVGIKVVWVVFHGKIITEEKHDAIRESRAVALCLMYTEMVENIKDAATSNKFETRDFLLLKFQISINGLMKFDSEDMSMRIEDIHERAIALDSASSKFIDDLNNILADLKEIIETLCFNLKIEE